MRTSLCVVGLTFLVGCDRTPPSPTPAATVVATEPSPPPPIAGLPVTLTLKQRSQTVVPGSANALKLSIDDITHGKVRTSIRGDKDVLLQPTDLAQGDRKTFEYQKRHYQLTVVELNNALIGEDFATFKLEESTPPQTPAAAPLTESQKIDRLIARVEAIEGAKFVRNGTEHSPKEAARHLQEKREYAGDKLKTADEFIDQIASRSSLSGAEYEIRFSDGRVVKAGEFLRRELKALSLPPPMNDRAPSPSTP